MKASPLILIAALAMFGCVPEPIESEDAPDVDVNVPDGTLGEEDKDLGAPQDPEDPMITFVRTQNGESTTSKVRISSLHLSDFPAPHMGSPKDIWDENVRFEIVWNGNSNTQVLTYRTKATAEEYIQFFSTELTEVTTESQNVVEIVRGKNEFGDPVEVMYTLLDEDDGLAVVRITAQG